MTQRPPPGRRSVTFTMPDELDGLLARVDDQALRADLRAQIDRIRAKRTFGLVFESHLPERVRLPEHPIRIGSKVAFRDEPKSATYEVLRVRNATASICKVQHLDGSKLSPNEDAEVVEEDHDVDTLVVIADFGEPIYPGLRVLGSVDRGGDKPAHVVIKGENHHVLEALRFTQAGKVDCIYIDPPYNSGARDWKYDNHYVDETDAYRHSKWLAFMERRILLAKELLNPERSVLIITIDEKEVHRLGLLLEQTFPGARSQMVSSVINPAGTGRQSEFSRTNEYIFFLQFGDVVIQPMPATKDDSVPVEWEPFRRRDLESRRGTSKGGRSQFYPIYVDRQSKRIVGTGDPLPHDVDRHTAPVRPGCATVFPVREDGTEMNWALTRQAFEQRLEKGYVRLGRHQPGGHQEYVVSYLRTGPIADIEEGRARVTGRNQDGSVNARYPAGKRRMPLTQWDFPSHDAQRYGTTLLNALTPGRRFPFPKSLYAVEDAIRIAVGEYPDAVVLDFFGGSGTTTHAVARLNRQDGGRRQSIVVTNNEVSAAEADSLRREGFRLGDPEWEALGIFEHITRPRITAAVTGLTPDGQPVKGDYRFTDEFPMAKGFEENVKFVELVYLDPEDVELDLAFTAIEPLLWLRAGALGPALEECFVPTSSRKPFAWTERYGVLFDPDRWRGFVEKLPETATTSFVVTDSQATFAGVAAEVPDHLEVVQLYESYLTTFRINEG
jgi:adenine-specific DNA-methyltransferase